MAIKLGRIGTAFERMSDRERKIVLGGGALVLIAGVVLVGVLLSRKVSALEEQVAANDDSLHEIEQMAPKYLMRKLEDKATDEQLERASKESLQATVLNIAKTVEYEKKDDDGSVTKIKMSDAIKFANATEILAELTQKQKKGAVKKKSKAKKGAKEVFLATIDAQFQNVPDEAILRFLAKLESHPDPLFGIALDMSRTQPSHDQFQATVKIGQFRFGVLEE